MKMNVEYVAGISGELDKYLKKKSNHTEWSYGWSIKQS